MLFDEDFNLVEGAKQVAARPDELRTLAPDNLVMEKSGFLYVYTSNKPQAEKYYPMSPYPYAANSPMNNIDVNGDSIIVKTAGGQSLYWGYTKASGYGFYSNVTSTNSDGVTTTTQTLYTGNDQFVGLVSSALGRLMMGSEGASMVNYLSNDSRQMGIVQQGTNAAFDEGVWWNPNDMGTNVPQDSKKSGRPAFVGLAHELAHMEDTWKGTKNTGTWQSVEQPDGTRKNTKYAEIYASHREDQIRAEHGLPLRTSYAGGPNGEKDHSTRLIDSKTRSSLYVDNTGQINSTTNRRNVVSYTTLGKKQLPYVYKK